MLTTPTAPTPPARDAFEVMQRRIADAYYHWRMWKELFLRDRSKIDLMNKTATAFFVTIQHVLLRDVLLSLFKLNDKAGVPVKGGGQRDNLSLAWIIQDTLSTHRPAAAQIESMRQLKTKLDGMLQPLEPLRHWTIAHDDRQAAVNPEIVPKMKLKTITEALETAVALAETIGSVRCPDEGFGYRDTIALGGADTVLAILDKYQRYRDIDLRRFQNSLLQTPR